MPRRKRVQSTPTDISAPQQEKRLLELKSIIYCDGDCDGSCSAFFFLWSNKFGPDPKETNLVAPYVDTFTSIQSESDRVDAHFSSCDLCIRLGRWLWHQNSRRKQIENKHKLLILWQIYQHIGYPEIPEPIPAAS